MNIYIALLLLALIPTLFIVFLPRKKEFFDNPLVRGFGLGVYTALILLLILEGYEHGELLRSSIYLGIGILVSFLIGFIVKEFHHHHEHTDGHHDHTHTKASTLKLLLSDFLHNIVDGMSLVASTLISPVAGITSLFGILGHQIVQQGGQQIILVESGLTPKKALFVSFLISLSVFLGLFIQNENLEIFFICVSAGLLIFKVYSDIRHTKWTYKTALGFFVGILILTSILFIIPHTHE